MGSERIIYMIDSLGAGGTERQLLYLLTNLDRKRYDPHVLTLYGKDPGTHHYGPAVKTLNISIDSLDQNNRSYGRIVSVLRYTRYMWHKRPRIVQGCLHYSNIIARMARPFCPPHILITSERGVYPPGAIRSENFTQWLDDHLIVNSPGIRQQVLAATSRPDRKITVIPNAVPIEKFAVNVDPGLRERLFPGKRFVIGMVGRIDQIKDHPTLLKAIWLSRANWPTGLAVFLIGDVSVPEMQHHIDQLIEAYDLKNVIHQFQVTDEIAPYYHAADITILPSLSEGFPNVVLESFAAGKPVIVSVGANGAGLVEPGCTGWQFPTVDAEALSACLQTAWNSSAETIAKMGESAHMKATQFSIQATVQGYVNLYETLTHK